MPGNKGFYVAWQSGSQQVAVVFAGVLGVALSTLIPPEQLAAWGWRIPLIVGCLTIPFIYLIRRTLQETDEFAARSHHPTPSQIYAAVLSNWRIVLTGIAMVVHLTEIVPAEVRTAGFSVAYSLAITVGVSTPAIVTYLIHATGNRAMPGVWLSLGAAVALVAIWVSRPAENVVPKPMRVTV